MLKLRSDCKTSDGFFNMLRDKFGLHTIREDAAKIHKSIDGDITVSYTHLDVYKRQLMAYSGQRTD